MRNRVQVSHKKKMQKEEIVKHRVIALILGAVIFSNSFLLAQESVNLSLIGSLDIEGGIDKVAITGDIALFAKGPILSVVDVSNLEEPQLVGWIDLGIDIWDIDAQGSIVYATLGGRGLRIIDISNPQEPEAITWIELEDFGGWGAVEVWDDIAYILSYDRSIYIYDVSDSENPELLSSIQGRFLEFSINDEYLYVIIARVA